MGASRFWALTDSEIRINPGKGGGKGVGKTGGKGSGKGGKGGGGGGGGGGGRGSVSGWSGGGPGGGPAGPDQPDSMTSPVVNSVYVYVKDITNDFVLYTKAPTTVWASNVAGSVVKMASARILMDFKSADLAETTTIVAGDLVSGTDAGLLLDDVITLNDLLHGMLLPSGNDAAYAVARVVGTHIFDLTSTGNTGVVRFVEEMNILATTLGLSNTVYTDPAGVIETGNVSNITETSAMAEHAWENSTIRAISLLPDYTMTITGSGARTYDVEHTHKLINGPFPTPAQLTVDNILAGKTAKGNGSSWSTHTLWSCPAGYEIQFTLVHNGVGDYNRYLDLQGLLYEIMNDFSYLTDGFDVGTDAQFSNVLYLAGGDAGFTDESSVARTVIRTCSSSLAAAA